MPPCFSRLLARLGLAAAGRGPEVDDVARGVHGDGSRALLETRDGDGSLEFARREDDVRPRVGKSPASSP